jgi:hypothetical protein
MNEYWGADLCQAHSASKSRSRKPVAINSGLGMFAQPNWIKRLVMTNQLVLGVDLGTGVVGTKFKTKETEFL